MSFSCQTRSQNSENGHASQFRVGQFKYDIFFSNRQSLHWLFILWHDVVFRSKIMSKIWKLEARENWLNLQMSSKDVQSTSWIANVCIYVEQAIKRMKVFHILQHEIPINILPLVGDIVSICALTNFLPPLCAIVFRMIGCLFYLCHNFDL